MRSEMGMAVPVVSKEYFLAGLEMTPTILTTSGLAQESLKGAGICLSLQKWEMASLG